jgi:hypothetical protein
METAAPERTDNNRGKFESSAAFCLGLFRGPVEPLILVTGSPEYMYLRTFNHVIISLILHENYYMIVDPIEDCYTGIPII